MVAITKFGLLASAVFATSSLARPLASAEEAINEFVERFASPTANYTARDLEEFEKRQSGYFAVTGINDGQQGVRQPVQTLAANADQWNIFLLAMQQLQNSDQSQKLSYYQVAGIHGVPNIPWDGVNGNTNYVGYCTHDSILFPVWHRCYVALFEMIWFSSLQTVINQFPAGSTRTRYANAASGMRFPYWDWANAGSGDVMPSLFTQSTVTLNTPNGQQTVTNPLFRYGFHPLNAKDMIQDPWDFWPVTFRYPTRNDRAGVTQTYSQNNQAVAYTNNMRQSLRNSVYNLFTACSDYTYFSNDGIKGGTCGGNSLESIHNLIHLGVGGGSDGKSPQGHMTVLWYAAFDPIFWFHHMNVERLFSMWQACHKDSYFNTQQSLGHATYYFPSGTVVNSASNLAPFHMDTSGNFWKGNNVYNHRIFGSTFPEFVGWDGTSSSMIATVNRLYGNAGQTKRDALPDPLAAAIPSLIDMIPDASVASLLTPTGRKYEWVANIETSRFGLDGSYTIFVFDGQPASEDPGTWGLASNLVGQVGIFSQPNMAGQMGDDLVYGAVPLTTALVNRLASGDLQGLDPEFVTPYLAKNLHWRVSGVNGAVPNNQVPRFELSVTHSAVIPAKSDNEFPTYVNFIDAVNATAGKSGGLGDLIGSLVNALDIADHFP